MLGEFCAANSEGSKLGSRADTALEEALVEAKGWVTPVQWALLSHSVNSALFSQSVSWGWPIPSQHCKILTKEAAFEAEEVLFLAV